MMTQERDYEDALRRALAAAAESIEPTGDGLQRIRHRLDSPRSPRSVFSGCAEWLELRGTRLLVRLEPAIETGRTALRRTEPLRGALVALASFLASLLGGRGRGRRRVGGHRTPASPARRLGPARAWLKPIFAVAAAVAIVVGGVVTLNHVKGPLINPLNSVGSAGPGSSPGGAGKTANSKRWKLPIGVKATQKVTGPDRRKGVTSVLPAIACTPTPTPSATTTTPAGSPTPTPTPSVTASATGTPTPQPTDTSLPTSTPTASAATGGTATATAAAMVVPYKAPAVVQCAGGAPKPSHSP
jgi:hypothetical protein